MTLVKTPWSPEWYLGQTEVAVDTRWIFNDHSVKSSKIAESSRKKKYKHTNKQKLWISKGCLRWSRSVHSVLLLKVWFYVAIMLFACFFICSSRWSTSSGRTPTPTAPLRARRRRYCNQKMATCSRESTSWPTRWEERWGHEGDRQTEGGREEIHKEKYEENPFYYIFIWIKWAE